MASQESKNYSHSQEKLFNLSLKAVREFGYKIDSLDKVNGLINFKTGLSWKSWGGQEMSILILENGDKTCSVDISGRRNSAGVIPQVYDWGEASGIAKKIFEKISEGLKATPENH